MVSLWRYPVKSMQGERLDEAVVGDEGLEGDRRFALFDADTGLGLTARRVPELLFARARWCPDGGVAIETPDGTPAEGDDELSRWLGRPVELRPASHDGTRAYENPNLVRDDGEDERWEPFHGARGAFHDSPRSRVSLVSEASLGGRDPRRFRPNVVVDGAGEDALVGTSVAVGAVHLDVRKRIARCVMVTRPQPGGLGRDLEVLRSVNLEHEGALCVGALVESPGTLRVGDQVVPTPTR